MSNDASDRSMLGVKSAVAVDITLSSIELVHMMRKQQGVFATAKPFSLKQQVTELTA